MTQDNNFLGELLADPAILAQIEPLLNGAIDARIQPIAARLEQFAAQVEQLTQGVTLMAQATVEQAQAQAQAQAQEQPAQYQQPQFQQPQYPQNGLPPQAPSYQPPAPAQTATVDKLAQFAPLLMQYLSGQNQGNNLGNIAETLSAAAQIGNVMNAPMWQGMKMATEMMSMSGRAGMDPVTAADTLGGMIDGASTNGSGSAEA